MNDKLIYLIFGIEISLIIFILIFIFIFPLSLVPSETAFINISSQKIEVYLCSPPKNNLRLDSFLLPAPKIAGETLSVKGRIKEVLFEENGEPCLTIFNKLAKTKICVPGEKVYFIDQQVGRDLENGKRIIPNFKLSEETKKDLLNKKIIATGLEVINNKIVGRYLSVYENK